MLLGWVIPSRTNFFGQVSLGRKNENAIYANIRASNSCYPGKTSDRQVWTFAPLLDITTCYHPISRIPHHPAPSRMAICYKAGQDIIHCTYSTSDENSVMKSRLTGVSCYKVKKPLAGSVVHIRKGRIVSAFILTKP